MVQQVRLGMYAVTRSSATRSDDLKQHVAIIDALLRENEEDVRDAIIVHTVSYTHLDVYKRQQEYS